MNCCDHNECCGHSDDRIGAEIGMLHNLLRRQMACMTEKTANAANVTGMQAMIVHHLIIHEKQGDIFCLLYTSPSPRDISGSRMPSSA